MDGIAKSRFHLDMLKINNLRYTHNNIMKLKKTVATQGNV